MIVDEIDAPEAPSPRPAPEGHRTALYGTGVAALLVMAFLAYFYARSAAVPPAIEAERQGPRAPTFSAPGFDGDEVTLAAFRGRPVVLNFWASWCAPCRAEAPAMERTWQAYRDRGLVFLGVDIQDTDAEARSFLREFGVTYPNVRDASNEVALAYGVTGLPSTFFIDEEGRVEYRWLGPLSEQQLVARIEELLR